MQKLGLAVVSIFLVISLVVYFTFYDSKKIMRLHAEYMSVDVKCEFYGKIIQLKTDKGACFVTLEKQKIFLKTSGNYMYPEVYLDRIVSVGDIIEKKSGSDSVFVTKGELKYYFLHGAFINKKN